MHRLLVDPETIESGTCPPPPEAARHLRAVRLKDAEIVEFFDGNGTTRAYGWKAATGVFEAAGEPVFHERRPGGITLFACVSKGSRWDWTLEKATELGAKRIVPVLSANTIVRIDSDGREAKRERWEKIAAEAARQSDAAWLPEIAPPVSFGEAAAEAAKTACFAGIISDPPPPALLDALEKSGAARDGELSLFTGPEGDFSQDEIEKLRSFAHPASFGPSVLRAETAAIFGLSVLTAWRR